MKWILIVLISSGYVVTPIQVEFKSEELCLIAKEHFNNPKLYSRILVGEPICLKTHAY
jgi:hypothetical protein